MAIENDVQNLSDIIAGYGATHDQKMTDLNDAKLAANAAAAEINKMYRTRALYVSSAGDDANPGTLAAPVKTAQRVVELWEARGILIVNFLTNFIWDWSMVSLASAPDYIKLYGRAADNSYVNRDVEFVDSVNVAANPGNFRSKASTKIASFGIDFVLNTSKAGSIFENGNHGIYDFSTGSVRRNAASTGSATLVGRGFRAPIALSHANFIIDPTAAGYVFTGIAAGADPNTDNLINSSIISA
ncbi:MAG: hypothetical protein L3J65_11020 [Robiginitomaculum sp.]|nr:hypothetical protein [Robiginitomaculum sp.]